MRYQSVWLSRRNATRPSSRILARCWDRADCDRPTASARRVDVALAPFDQLAKDHQPPLIGERAKDVRDLRRLFLEGLGIEGAARHASLHLFRYCLFRYR